MKLKLSVLSIALLGLYGCGGSNSGAPADDNKNPPSRLQTSLIKTTTLAMNDTNCPTGGVQISLGLDKNQSNQLEPEEILQNHFYCNSGSQIIDGDEIQNSDALVSILAIARNDSRCALGGQMVIVGHDADKNNRLSTSEIVEEHILCSDGQYSAPGIMINAIVASPAVLLPGNSAQITATISNLGTNDVLTWRDSEGKVIQPISVNQPNIISVEAGETSGSITVQLEIRRTKDDSTIVVQTQILNVTIADVPSKTQSVVMDKTQVILPEGYSTKNVTGDFKGVVMYADATQQLQRSGLPTPAGTELLGFTSERSALSQGTKTADILTRLEYAIEAKLNNRGTITEIAKKTLANGDISARYNIVMRDARQTTALLLPIIEAIGVNKVGGVIDPLVADVNEKAAQNFQFDLVVSYDSEIDNLVMTSTLVAKELFDKYVNLIDATTSESVRAPVNATIKVQNDVVTAIEQTDSKADFLFVIDNSNSMSNEQDEISMLTQTFLDEVSASGLDYRVGTITTDDDTLRGNGFTDNSVQIAEDLKPGIRGSAYERGIYFAEKALTPITGTAALAGYPRENASLSVVIMSDEESQYPTRDFDVNNNLFVTNAYRVYSIVEPSDAARSQYDDLSQTTLGLVLNIKEKSEYKQFVTDIANNAGASTVGYPLSVSDASQVISTSLSVKVNNVEVARDKANGWSYYPQTNSVSFRGNAIPAVGAEIVIAYNYVELEK